MDIKDKILNSTDIPINNINLKSLITNHNSIHNKISTENIFMILNTNLSYYGEFTQAINFKEANIGTCGVNVTKNGMVFYWDPKFIDSLTSKGMVFILLHEIFHLLFDHNSRGIGYDHKIANLAQDMIINSIIHGELIISEKLDEYIEMPKDENGRNTGVFIPHDYKGEHIFEDLYVWLKDKYTKWKNENADKINKKNKPININVDKNGNLSIKNDEDTNGSGGSDDSVKGNKTNNNSVGGDNGDENTNGNSGDEINKNDGYSENNGRSGEHNENRVGQYPLEHFFENIESNKGQTLDIHFDDDVSEEIRKQTIEAQIQSLKSRGLTTKNVEKILNKLRKKRKDYLKEIKRTLSNMIFGTIKRKSITKINRRDIWGLKGHRKYKTRINCILDTSGSMGGEFEKVLSYVFQKDIEINMLQIDTELKKHIVIRKMSQLQHMTIEGLGGTYLSPGLKYIADNKELNKLNTVILTDGETDKLDMTGVKGKVLILSTHKNCPIMENTSKVKQIIIDSDKFEVF